MVPNQLASQMARSGSQRKLVYGASLGEHFTSLLSTIHEHTTWKQTMRNSRRSKPPGYQRWFRNFLDYSQSVGGQHNADPTCQVNSGSKWRRVPVTT